jgi:hypothetical protein
MAVGARGLAKARSFHFCRGGEANALVFHNVMVMFATQTNHRP